MSCFITPSTSRLCLIILNLFAFLPPKISSSAQISSASHSFEEFVSRQHFPTNHQHHLSPSPSPSRSPSDSEDSSSFRANCSVPICEGSLAPIFCSGPLISSAWFFGVQGQCPGSKLLHAPSEVMSNFRAIIRDRIIKKGDFLQFCGENFANTPYLKPANLSDWAPNPANVRRINSPKMRKFATVLHEIWPNLTREFIDDVHRHQDRYPILSVPNRFVVPGGFFKLYFYWDTYWILKGLYFSNLTETARGMLQNFAHVLRFHGFIPNSGNVQLSRRSQPPMFTQMIADYFDASHNKSFLTEYLPHAEKELNWWKENRSVIVENGGGMKHEMFRYKAMTNCPRPENFLEDYQLGIDTPDPTYFWSSTASACESGLDFSSRWYKWGTAVKELKRSAIGTNDVLPVDLNVFMAWNYQTMAKLYGLIGDQRKSNEFGKMAEQLKQSIDAIFWEGEAGAWFDFDLAKGKLRTKFYPSNVYPLLLDTTGEKCTKALEYLRGSGALGFKGGIPSSLEGDSNEQWDFPNGWAPQQHLFVLSLLKCRGKSGEAVEIGQKVANDFLITTYNGLFNPSKGKPAQIWEKYDVRSDDGQPGFGGEYPAQSGFGWTNGVILEFVRMFYMEKEKEKPKERIGNAEMEMEEQREGKTEKEKQEEEERDRQALLALETVSFFLQTVGRDALFPF